MWKKKAQIRFGAAAIFGVMLLCWIMCPCAAYATTDYAKNASTWLADQLFWIGVGGLCIALAVLAIKRNFVGAVITVLGGGIILYFIKNPEKISSIGETVAKVIFK